jgi:multiple sugar transport system permease protein
MRQTATVERALPGEARARIFRNARIVVTYAVMILLAFIFIFPVVFMLVSSFKPNRVIFEDLRSIKAFLPTTFTLDNYDGVFDRTDFARFMFNSVFIVSATVGIGLFVNSMAAYALSRLNWVGRAIMLSVIVALLIIPFEAIAVPLLFVVIKLPWLSAEGISTSWLNSLHVQIIPFIADAFSIFLFYQFFLDLPKELDEAARVDGASRFRIYWNILVPISRPVIATVAILQFLVRWGDYLWPVMSVQGEKARPLTVGMATFFGQTPDWGQIMAYASMITIPVLIVFLLFQKWFIQSVATSGLKG